MMNESQKKNAKEKLTKLKVQQMFLTKSCKTSINALKLSNPTLLTEITTLDQNLETERTQDKQRLESKIIEIFEKLQEASIDLNDGKNLKDFHAENCREKLVAIQKKISNLKEEIEKQNYLLWEDEKKLNSEVLLAQRRLEETSHSHKTNNFDTSSKVKKAKSTQKYLKNEDIVTFEKYVEKKGVTGGWEENDHLLFLRLRKRHWRGRDAFFSAVQAQLPDLTLEIIQEHENWYQEHESLREKHKNAIEIWKANKKKEENRKKAASEIKKKSISSSDLNENAKVKAEIEKWKQQRQAQQEEMAKAKEQKRHAEEMKLKKEQRKKMQMRASIMLYREQKEKEQQELKQLKEQKMQEEKEEKAAQAKQLIKTFRKLDKLFVEKQKLLRERPSITETVLPKVAVSVEAKRDPVRVLQHTKVWQTHCKTKPSPFKPIIHLRNMPHLAVPEWRRGVV